jgi:DNA-binding Lrp family transcriptional regulator
VINSNIASEFNFPYYPQFLNIFDLFKLIILKLIINNNYYIVGLLSVSNVSEKLEDKESKISSLDRKLLKILLQPNGDVKSSKTLAAKLGIPITTVRRRRKRLESTLLKLHYVLDIEKFGWRRVDFFIAIKNGMVNAVASKLLDSDEVTYVGKSIGEHTIDLRVEAIVKDNTAVLDILEKIKAMDGVNDVVWSEIVSVVGRKISIPSSIIDKI